MNPVIRLCRACATVKPGARVIKDGLPALARAAMAEYDRVRLECHELRLAVARERHANLYPMTDLA